MFDWVKARYTLKSDDDYPKIQQGIFAIILIFIYLKVAIMNIFMLKLVIWHFKRKLSTQLNPTLNVVTIYKINWII
jgi:hypothetical protein